MSFISTILGLSTALKTSDTIVGKGLDLADNAFFTDEEKATMRIKMAQDWANNQRDIAKQSQPTAISRRFIAWAVMVIVIISLAIAIFLVFKGDLVTLSHFQDVLKTFWIGEAFVTVIVFYFGPHVFGALKR